MLAEDRWVKRLPACTAWICLALPAPWEAVALRRAANLFALPAEAEPTISEANVENGWMLLANLHNCK
jgi:hypothetical protein